MKKLYDKSELWFALLWIIAYVVGTGLCDMLSLKIGLPKILTLAYLLIMSVFFVLWIRKHNLQSKYGFQKPNDAPKKYLYFIPLIVIISMNLWLGVYLNYTIVETIIYVFSMFCVGFVEEVIFRGFLFKAMEKDNLKSAVIVSSITFGIGHIVNLFNTSGQHLVATLCQICYAVVIGFLFVIIFYKSGSLLPCIITHSMFNALSAFSHPRLNEFMWQIIIAAIMIVIALAYSIYIIKTNKKDISN